MQDTYKRIQVEPASQTTVTRTNIPILFQPATDQAFSSPLEMSSVSRRFSSSAGLKPPAQQPLRILLADDHAIVRKGLKRILSKEFKHATFGEAEDATQVLESVLRQSWELVLLDLTMPGRSGADVLSQIIRARPKLPVLICSIHPEEHYAMALLKAGAAGYISKDAGSQDIVDAVKKLLAGERHISPALMANLVSQLSAPAPAPIHDTLSARERQVMLLLAAGHTVKEIAFDLGLSPKTISTYRFRLLKKMSLTTNGGIIRYALIHKLVA